MSDMKKIIRRTSIIGQAAFLLCMLLNVDSNLWNLFAVLFTICFTAMILTLEDDYK